MTDNARPGTGTPHRSAAPLLAARHISRSFGGVHALVDADIEIWPGEIHVLAGENGSGKSTLLRCLSGALKPDGGVLERGGSPIALTSIRDAMQAGITRISQELSLVPDLSVAENIFLGHARRGFSIIDRAGMQRQSQEILGRLGCDIDVRAPVRRLSADQRQLVEIARALSFESTVLLLDEPTSSLDLEESASLFETMRALAATGVGLVFISHRVPEMMEVGDRFTVLRDGHLVDSGCRGAVDSDWVVTRMVGREVSLAERRGRPTTPAPGEAVLRVVDVSDRKGRVSSATFEVRPGEVVGLAGLVGAGKTELLELISGVTAPRTGSVTLEGTRVPASVNQARSQGLALVPEDRRAQGIVPGMSVLDNVLLGKRAARNPFKNRRRERGVAGDWCRKLGVKGGLGAPIGTLSGGNQQKVVIARALEADPKVLLLDDPTRGIDIGAKAEIYELISQLAEDGLAVLFASSELVEILAASTRVLIMHDGAIAADLPVEGLTEERIIAIATGVAQ